MAEVCYAFDVKLSALDHKAVQAALDLRRTMIMPDIEGSEESNETGELLAEICRGWMEMLGKWPPDESNATAEGQMSESKFVFSPFLKGREP